MHKLFPAVQNGTHGSVYFRKKEILNKVNDLNEPEQYGKNENNQNRSIWFVIHGAIQIRNPNMK